MRSVISELSEFQGALCGVGLFQKPGETLENLLRASNPVMSGKTLLGATAAEQNLLARRNIRRQTPGLLCRFSVLSRPHRIGCVEALPEGHQGR